jgi:hypothetical protein
MLFDAAMPLVTAEAAEAWGVTVPTVCRWVKLGHVAPARTLPGRGGYLFAVEEIERVRRLFAQGLRFGTRPTAA